MVLHLWSLYLVNNSLTYSLISKPFIHLAISIQKRKYHNNHILNFYKGKLNTSGLIEYALWCDSYFARNSYNIMLCQTPPAILYFIPNLHPAIPCDPIPCQNPPLRLYTLSEMSPTICMSIFNIVVTGLFYHYDKAIK